MSRKFVIGIDEVGRGCLAGPVTVTALAVPVNSKLQFSKSKQIPKLKDSKKLSKKQRELWVEYLKTKPHVLHVTKSISPKIIDKINVAQAANLAAYRALKDLVSRHALSVDSCEVFLDGGLYIKSRNHQLEFFGNAETVIKGDEKIRAVSLASIVAKVTRDRHMVRLHKKLPNYSFHSHKGYSTKAHKAAIRQFGLSPLHRLTFTRKYRNIVQN